MMKLFDYGYQEELLQLSPFEVVYGNKVLDHAEIIPQTTKDQPILIIPEFIRTKNHPESEQLGPNIFFDLRNILISSCIQEFWIDDEFGDKKFEVPDIFKSIIEDLEKSIPLESEISLYHFICVIMRAIFNEDQLLIPWNIGTLNKYGNVFLDTKRKFLSADFAVIDYNINPLVLFELKTPQLNIEKDAIYQSLEQVRFEARNSERKIVFGCITNLKQWIITAYKKRNDSDIDSAEKFYVSQCITVNHKLPLLDQIKKIGSILTRFRDYETLITLLQDQEQENFKQLVDLCNKDKNAQQNLSESLKSCSLFSFLDLLVSTY